MNANERLILRRNHTLLVEHLDPNYLLDILYEKGAISDEFLLQEDPVRSRWARKILLIIAENCSFKVFIEALEYENTYSFLSERLQLQIQSLESVNEMNECLPVLNKPNIFTARRRKLIEFRHELKRLSHSGMLENFNKMKNTVITKWENEVHLMSKMNITSRQDMADMYFMALDAEVEHRRVIYDTTLYKDDIFKQIQLTAVHTTNPMITTMMFLARFGSSLVMAGKPLDEGLSYLHQAKQHMDFIPACRETGIVLYIEYNILSQKFAASPSEELRRTLLQQGGNAIDHFDKEDEEIGLDFKRMILLKICHVHLGIGLFLDFLPDVSVTEHNRQCARCFLEQVRHPRMWNRMETRWKMFYYIAKSRFLEIENKISEALKRAEKAEKCAKAGNFQKERINIYSNIQQLRLECEKNNQRKHNDINKSNIQRRENESWIRDLVDLIFDSG